MAQATRGMMLARIAAVASSVVLVGLYVVYRTGGQTVLPGSKGGIVRLNGAAANPNSATPTSAPATAPFVLQSAGDWALIGSSKGGAVFPPSTFSGSKFAPVFTPANQPVLFGDNPRVTTQPTTAQAPPAARQPARPAHVVLPAPQPAPEKP